MEQPSRERGHLALDEGGAPSFPAAGWDIPGREGILRSSQLFPCNEGLT